MVVRRVKQTGHRFLGCSRFPECTGTAELPAWFHMVEAGNAQLPGMEDL